MRILITGVAGYLGSATADLLLTKGIDILGIDNLSTGHEKNIPTGVDFRKIDILDPDLHRQLDKIDGCIHFAGLISSNESMKNQKEYFKNNVTGSVNLINSLRAAGTEKIVFSSSAAVYGDSSSMAISESNDTHPTSVYGKNKLDIDNLLSQLSNAHLLRTVSLRYFNAAGSYKNIPELHSDESHLIPLAVDTAYGRIRELSLFGDDYPTHDGTCIRDYVHVEDLARAHFLALNYLNENYSLIANLGSGIGSSNLEIIKTIEKISGRKVPLKISQRREGDPAVLVSDIQLAQTELSWTPAKSINDCIEDCINSRKRLQ